MNENQTLELQIKSSAEQAKNSVDTLVKSLTNVENVLTNIYLDLGRMEKNAKNGINSISKNADGASKSMKNAKDNADKATTSFSKLGKAISLGGAYVAVKRLTMHFLNWMDLAVDRTEQMNLFNVVFKNIEKDGVKTFSTLGREATKFQYKMNEAFGTNMTETMKYQGLFQSMGENVGIPDNYSAIMSETMTKLTYDLASLYNKSESTTGEALRAGVYAGQTKPLRSFGIDVTQTSMQPILDSLGITDRSIKQMSQAEKEILRYIATLKQAKVAMGDFANTIESPANQMKIFKQQLIEAKVALTSLFMGAFAKILPYANAILMVIKEISKAIANMFGIKLQDFNSGIATQEDYFTDLGDSIDDATGSAKELKRQILGFDEIHNINEDKDNGGSGTTAVSGGIDQRLLDAIKGYDNGMDKIKMKATEIRDKIMEWLGFHKEINPLTGETYFVYDGIQKTLKNMWQSFAGLSTEGKILVSIISSIIGFRIAKKLKNVLSIVGSTGLGSAFGNLVNYIKIYKNLSGGLIKGIQSGTTAWLKQYSGVLKVVGAIGSIISVISGVTSMLKSFKDSLDGISTSSSKVASQILSIELGATGLGAVLGGPFGALIGAIAGALITATTAIIGYNNAMQQLIDSQVFGTLNISVEQWTEILNANSTALADYSAKQDFLSQRLNTLATTFDENLEKVNLMNYTYSLLGKTVSEEVMTTMIDSVNGMCTATSSAIEETTNYQLDIWGDFFSKRGELNTEENKKFLQSIIDYGNDQKNQLAETQNNITSTYQNAIATRGYLTDEEYTYIEEQLQKIKDLTNQSMSVANSDIIYWKNRTANESSAIDKESYTNLNKALDTYTKEQQKIAQTNYNTMLNSLNAMHKNGEIDTKEYNNRLTELDNQRTKDLAGIEKYRKSVIDEATKGLQKKYKELDRDTSDSARKQRQTMEDVFKLFNIDTSKLTSQVRNASKSVNDVFGSTLRDTYQINVRLDKSNLMRDLNQVNSSLGTSYSLKANGGIFSNGSWQDIPQYSNGGAPRHGSLFWAGENGAEIVANANRRTEVLNRSQIASAIYGAVLTAMSQVSGQSSQIDVHVHTDEGTVIDRIEQKTKQTGTFPLTIPGL